MWWLSVSVLVGLAACGILHAAALLFPAFGERLMPTASEAEESAGEAREYWALQATLFVAIVAVMFIARDVAISGQLLMSLWNPK